MTLSHMDAEREEACKQENARKPDDLVLRVMEHIEKIGKMLTELGKKDAQKGKKPYPADAFPALVVKVFRIDADEDHETVEAVADLWESDYLGGYIGEKENVSNE